MEGITKKEVEVLEKHGYKFSDESAFGREIDHIIVIVHDPSKIHDSGYPWLRIFGSKGWVLYDMGWHDHYLTEKAVNTDALGKNVWRVMPWCEKGKWRTQEDGLWGATLWCREGVWS
jgi:hypothetical protein